MIQLHVQFTQQCHATRTATTRAAVTNAAQISTAAGVSVSSAAAVNAHFPAALKSPAVIICRSGCCCRTSALHGSVSVALTEKLLDPAAILFVFGDQ